MSPDVELLVVAGCPHTEAAQRLLRQALDDIGAGSRPLRLTHVTSQDQAERLGFLGSPSFCVDASDLLPDPARVPALACRLYEDQQPLPALPVLRQALKRALAAAANAYRT